MRSVTEMQAEIRDLTTRLNGLSRELGALNQRNSDDMAKVYENITTMAGKHPIKNKKLKAASDIAKREYIRILAFLAMQSNGDYEQKLLLIQRIVYGIKLNLNTEQIVKSGIWNINSLLGETLDSREVKKHKYSLLLDSLLVINATGQASEKGLQLVAELASIFRIEQGEILFLAKLAKSLLHQDQQDFATIPVENSPKWKGLFNHYIPKKWLEDMRVYCGMYTSSASTVGGYFAYLSKNKPSFKLITDARIGSFVSKEELIVSYESNGKLKKIKAKEAGYVYYEVSHNKIGNNQKETITKVYTASGFE